MTAPARIPVFVASLGRRKGINVDIGDNAPAAQPPFSDSLRQLRKPQRSFVDRLIVGKTAQMVLHVGADSLVLDDRLDAARFQVFLGTDTRVHQNVRGCDGAARENDLAVSVDDGVLGLAGFVDAWSETDGDGTAVLGLLVDVDFDNVGKRGNVEVWTLGRGTSALHVSRPGVLAHAFVGRRLSNARALLTLGGVVVTDLGDVDLALLGRIVA